MYECSYRYINIYGIQISVACEDKNFGLGYRCKPPLSKGGGPAPPVEGFKMNYKHNTNLTSRARNLRKNSTREENHLWYDFLRDYSIRFLRQKVIDNYIADFYCAKAKLIIELDGSQHYEETGLLRDRIRTEKIEERGLLVIRIPNNEIKRNFEGVCEYIDLLVNERMNPLANYRWPSPLK